jgi:hypothetical protein
VNSEEPQIDQKATVRPESRGALKALAVIIALFASVGLCGSVALGFGLTLLDQADGYSSEADDARLAERYSKVSESRPPRVLGEMLIKDSLKRIDFRPFLERPPISILFDSVWLRALSYGVVILGAILTLISRPLGPRLVFWASLGLIVHGAVEALALLQSGHAVAIEFLRDFEYSYRHVIELADIEGEFRNPFTGVRTLDHKTIQLIDLAYYLGVTVLWQVAALCLAICKPLASRSTEFEISEEAA